MDFKGFGSIERIGKVFMNITQKIHGTNAQIFITDSTPEEVSNGQALDIDGFYHTLRCGSRTRWITPDSDNYGFATFVYSHKEEFIRKLGNGQHFGEWAGPGINSGEGLSEKVFVLFEHRQFPPERPLPPQTVVVPVLYTGKFDIDAIGIAMENLKANGSKLALGFMRPEGVVVSIAGTRYKKVFDAEETQWKKGDETYQNNKVKKEATDYSHLLQPLRLEKLISRDEQFKLGFPNNLSLLVNEYIADLIKEEQITDTITVLACRGEIFKFIRVSLA